MRKEKLLHRPGIEPRPPAWQASILPLNQRCGDKIFKLIGAYELKHHKNDGDKIV